MVDWTSHVMHHLQPLRSLSGLRMSLLLLSSKFKKKCIIFTRSKQSVGKLYDILKSVETATDTAHNTHMMATKWYSKTYGFLKRD